MTAKVYLKHLEEPLIINGINGVRVISNNNGKNVTLDYDVENISKFWLQNASGDIKFFGKELTTIPVNEIVALSIS